MQGISVISGKEVAGSASLCNTGLTQLPTQEQLPAQVDEAIDELVDAHRQQLGLTSGQTDAVHSLQGPKKVKRLAGMVQVAPQLGMGLGFAVGGQGARVQSRRMQ